MWSAQQSLGYLINKSHSHIGTHSVYKGPNNNDRRTEHAISKLLVRGSAKSPPIKNKLIQKTRNLEKNKKLLETKGEIWKY